VSPPVDAPAGAPAPPGPPAPLPAAAAGERIYRQGLLPSGKPLRGRREGDVDVQGATAACATCHRRSGLGSWEGQSVIPPIIGRYLFRPGARNVEDAELPHVLGFVPHRVPYTEATLARAIRDGVDQQGRRLSYLMPRYALDDATMSSLISYLRGLTSRAEPGVGKDTLQFATVVTPDADPAARDGMLAVLRQFFADKNAGYRGDAPPLQSTRGVMYRVLRKWQLQVWELSGPPDTWEAQLHARQAATPVFAVLSGIGGRTWAPVHAFCERAGVPCLFPNADLPVAAEQDFYPLYFSRGVLLEAQLVAHALRARGEGEGPRRVVQVVREGDVGADAAAALRAALPAGTAGEVRTVPAGANGAALAAALAGVGPADALVLWLRPAELSALPAPPPARAVFASGILGGLERAPLPAAWRPVARLAYAYDLPEQRRVRMGFPLGWFKVRNLPLLDERVQTDTYLACTLLAEALGHMQDSFVRDYLVERLEVLVSHRLVNGYYPRLGLGPGQRFASKGGYLVRLAPGGGVVAETGWIVP
jgi:hypothetical protein